MSEAPLLQEDRVIPSTMDSSARLDLAATSRQGKDKKVADMMQHKEDFEKHLAKVEADLGKPKVMTSPDPSVLGGDAGGDMCVCVRARPLLAHESTHFPVLACANPKVAAMEPRMDVRGKPRPNVTEYEAISHFVFIDFV